MLRAWTLRGKEERRQHQGDKQDEGATCILHLPPRVILALRKPSPAPSSLGLARLFVDPEAERRLMVVTE